MIHGERYSGKTSIVSWIENLADFHQKIKVTIGDSVVVGGRKLLFTSDLSASINDVLKSIDNSKSYTLLIDDLEIFVKEDLIQRNGDNLSALIKAIGNAPKNIFFIITVNSWMARRIDTIHKWEDHFADVIDVSKFKLDQFLQTIWTRHNSTKMAVTCNDLTLTENQVKSIGMRLYKAFNGNIGLSLIAWCRNISFDLKIKNVKMKLPSFPWLVSELRAFFDILSLNKKLSFDEINQFDKSRVGIKNLIGRFRKIGILAVDERYITLDPFVGQKLLTQLCYTDRKAEYNQYLLEVLIEERIEKPVGELLHILFTYPFNGFAKLHYIKVISKDEYLLNLETLDAPISIVKYLNNHSLLKAVYKNNIS